MKESQKYINQEVQDFIDMLLPEVDSSRLIKPNKFALEIPEIGATAKPSATTPPAPKPAAPKPAKDNKPAPVTEPIVKPELPKEDNTAAIIKDELVDLKDSLLSLEREQRLQEISDSLRQEFEGIVKSLQSEINELKDAKVPQREEFDSGGAYKEHLFSLCTRMLDKILVPIIDIIPDYNLLGTQITSTYDDGTVKNAIVTINIQVPVDTFKHEFKCDMVVLNGMIQAPLYLTRGRNLIGMNKEDLLRELSMYSFTKMDTDSSYGAKKNPYSNSGDLLHKPDNQKQYMTINPKPATVSSPDSGWQPSNPRRV